MGQVPFAAPYEQRTVRFVEVCKHAHWRIKVYAVLADGREYDAALINAAKERVLPDLPRDDNEWRDHGAAILIVHYGEGAEWVLLDWWVEGCILRQRQYRALINQSDGLEDITEAGVVSCVWELPVLWFERRAWIDAMMRKQGDHDLETYLTTVLDGVVWCLQRASG